MQKCGAKKCKLGGIQNQMWYVLYLYASLHGVIKLRANAVFTIFALDLTVVCTFFVPHFH